MSWLFPSISVAEKRYMLWLYTGLSASQRQKKIGTAVIGFISLVVLVV
jgi:hypothetical protein